jgi:hypothetical protein
MSEFAAFQGKDANSYKDESRTFRLVFSAFCQEPFTTGHFGSRSFNSLSLRKMRQSSLVLGVVAAIAHAAPAPVPQVTLRYVVLSHRPK